MSHENRRKNKLYIAALLIMVFKKFEQYFYLLYKMKHKIATLQT